MLFPSMYREWTENLSNSELLQQISISFTSATYVPLVGDRYIPVR